MLLNTCIWYLASTGPFLDVVFRQVGKGIRPVVQVELNDLWRQMSDFDDASCLDKALYYCSCMQLSYYR